jgi:hypothetical protein
VILFTYGPIAVKLRTIYAADFVSYPGPYSSISITRLRLLASTPVRSFVLTPIVVVAFEISWLGGTLAFETWGRPLLAGGYLQYRWRDVSAPRMAAAVRLNLDHRGRIAVGAEHQAENIL